MKWYTKWYLTYPLVWAVTIVLTVLVFPPASYYDLGGVLGERLFVVTLCFAAISYGSKRINLGEKKIIERYDSADDVDKDKLQEDVRVERDDKGWYAYVYEKK